MPLLTNLRIGAAVIAVLAVLACVANSARADNPSVFDLTWDGSETSKVEECVDENYFCIEMHITGSIGVALDVDAPRLINVDSDILIPPQLPGSRPVISPNLWHNFDLLVGEYLTNDTSDTVSMVFRPAEIGRLRAYELFVDLTDGGQALSLTGGIEQSATSPLEPDVRFYVSGRVALDPPIETRETVPEPAALVLFLLGASVLISSRRHQ